MNRRSFLRFLLASAAAEAVAETIDIERLLWVPKPIITVPAMPSCRANLGKIVAEAWEAVVGSTPEDNLFATSWIYKEFEDETAIVVARNDVRVPWS